MIIFLISRIISSTFAFLYPGYKSYKALSRRPADEIELERWLMYWSVIAAVIAFEYVAEWLIRWIPLYYFMKMLFLLFLALPQTQGSTFIYQTHMAPLLQAHEHQIDAALTQFKLKLYAFFQERSRALWDQVSKALGLPTAPAAPPEPNVGATNPPSLADPMSGAAQMVSGWWSAYAPAIIANGAAYIASRQQAAQAQAAQNAASRREPGVSGYDVTGLAADTASILARRRALEAELATLPAAPVTTVPTASTPVASSSVSLNQGEARSRKRTDSATTTGESGSDIDASKYEKIDIGSGDDSPSRPRASWWGWGGRNSSYQYERVKDE